VYWRRRLSRLELAIYASVIAVILAVFLERLLYYMEVAERTVMEATVSNVNSALDVRWLYGNLGSETVQKGTIAAANPFELAGMSPGNFAGEVNSPILADFRRGQWVFDRSQRELIYVPQLRRGLDTADPDGALHFRLEDRGNAHFRLVSTSKYLWN
jgi:hypothetical protein